MFWKPNVVISVLGAHLLIMVALAVTQHKSPDSTRLRKQIVHGVGAKSSDKKTHGTYKGLTFDPPMVDFGSCAVSVVWRQKVRIEHDGSVSSPVTVISISGSSLNFHCSFVSNKIIEPSGNTTFEIAFLGREEGFVEDTLYVHTTEGSFPYHVKARGIANPFQLKPLVGVRLPVNSSFTPIIQLYNPFASALQVTEMFGSSCDLHIEMLSPVDKGTAPSDWWLVPPHQSKAIAKLNYLAQQSANLTAFVRIRTNSTGHPHGSLMLPISVEVTSQPLLYCPQQMLDFGVFKSSADPPKTINIFLFNSGTKTIALQSFTISPQSEGITVDFSPVKIAPSMTSPTLAAQVTFNPSAMASLRSTSGKITLKSKTGQYKVTIGYQVTVPTSYLQVNVSTTQFRIPPTNEETDLCQFVRIRNDFALPVHVRNAALSPQPFVVARNFTEVVLATRESAAVVEICLTKPAELKPPISISLVFSTNVSDLEVPVTVFTGELNTVWPEGCHGDREVDIGWLLEDSSRELYFALHNPNPVGVALQGWGTNNSNAVVKYLGSESGLNFRLQDLAELSNLTMASSLRPNHYAVFLAEIHPPPSGTANSVTLSIRTVYEEIKVKLNFKLVTGSIRTIPDPLIWGASFLDPYVSTDVFLNSSLEQAITVTGFQKPSSHYAHVELFNSTALVLASTPQSAGRLSYQLHWECAETLLSKFVSNWQLGERLWNALLDLDISRALYSCFQNISSALTDISSIRLLTRELGHVELPVATEIQWPRLSRNRSLRFPLTEVGQQSSAHLTLSNPTSNAISVQLLWVTQSKLGMKDFVKNLPEHLVEDMSLIANTTGNTFSISDEATLNQNCTLLLPPGSERHVKLNFSPVAAETYTTLLALKNNVTGIELVTLRGAADRSQFSLGNRIPDSTHPLIFDISDKLLKNCDGSWPGQFYTPSVTAKGSFTARNQGQFPIHVTGYEIESSECEGYGFRVLKCEPFTLQPNQSRAIDIAFTPDFTQTRVERTLRLRTSVGGGSTLTFSLVATVPAHMLILCAAILPGPSWEMALYYGAIFISLILVISVIAAAAFKADLLINSALVAMVTVVPSSKDVQQNAQEELHVLDFRKAVKDSSLPEAKENHSEASQSSCDAKNSRGKKNKSKKAKSSAKSNPVPPAVEAVPEAPRPPKTVEEPARPSVSPAPAACHVPKKEETPGSKPKAQQPTKKVSKSKSPVPVIEETQPVKPLKSNSHSSEEPNRTENSKPHPQRPQKASAPASRYPLVEAVASSAKTGSSPVPKPVVVTAPVVKPLEHSQAPLKQAPKPQPPVGKILPEVRKPEETTLPKPIGPRNPEKVSHTSSFPWTETDLRSTWSPTIVNTIPSYSVPTGTHPWYAPEPAIGPQYSEPSRDWFGLRSLANHVSDPWPNNNSRSNTDAWSLHTSTHHMRDENTIPSPTAPSFNQTYSPWSAPNWLEVSQRNYTQIGDNRREENRSDYDPFGGNFGGIWEPLPRNTANDPWQSYSQF